MAVQTIAKTAAWCRNCPNTIHPGDTVLIGPEHAKPGSVRQPMIHAACEGLDPYDPDTDDLGEVA